MTAVKQEEVPTRTRLRILDLLGSNLELEVVAANVRMTREEVIDIVALHGWPDRAKLRWAAERIREKAVDQTPAPKLTPVPEPAPAAMTPTLAPTRSSQPAANVGRSPSTTIDLGKASDIAATRKLAEKIEQLVADLQNRIREEQRTAAERQRARQEKERAKAEVERLEAELKAAKALLRGDAAPSSGRDTKSRAVRAWAAEQGLPHTTRGKVSAELLTKYEAAHPA